MNALSIVVHSIEELQDTLGDHIEKHFQPSLAIAFCSPAFPFESACHIFKECNIQLIGCTSAGEIQNDQITSKGFSFILMDPPPDSFRTIQFEHDDTEAYSSGEKIYETAISTFQSPGIILFISGVRVVGDGPVKGIRERMEREIPIYGGLAGDDLKMVSTYVFTESQISDFGVSAVIFDIEKIAMNGLAVGGWKPLGTDHTITKAEKNIIYEIDNTPALDLFLNYFGNIKYNAPTSDGLVTIAGQYPLKLENEDGSSYMRSLLIYDQENHALLAAGEIKTGTKFRFCPPPEFSVVHDTINSYEEFAKGAPNMDAIIMVSCKGRHTSFGPFLEDEISSIYEIWNAPMAGFLSYGEIGNTKKDGVCEFHNVTCSLVGLKEL